MNPFAVPQTVRFADFEGALLILVIRSVQNRPDPKGLSHRTVTADVDVVDGVLDGTPSVMRPHVQLTDLSGQFFPDVLITQSGVVNSIAQQPVGRIVCGRLTVEHRLTSISTGPDDLQAVWVFAEPDEEESAQATRHLSDRSAIDEKITVGPLSESYIEAIEKFPRS